MNYLLLCGDSLEKLKDLDDCSVDSIVTDPPYEISFMSKSWDSTGIAFNKELWKEALRVLKPGGHLIAFSGSRTYHRMAVAIEDAGFEIRDQIIWMYGQGFPKSLDVSKAIDKKFGAEREVMGKRTDGRYAYEVNTDWSNHADRCGGKSGFSGEKYGIITAPSTPQAKQWNGWGTALKPAHEPMVLARKPMSEKTVAENVLKWGVGALNIDGCRVGESGARTNSNGKRSMYGGNSLLESKTHNEETKIHDYGRFPANICHDGSEEVLSVFPYTKSGEIKIGQSSGSNFSISGELNKRPNQPKNIASNEGSASRYFYCAKASKKDRNEGLTIKEENYLLIDNTPKNIILEIEKILNEKSI